MKIAFATTFFTGATLPLILHLQERGHECDLYLFAQQGRTNLETLEFDAPVSGSRISTLSKSNHIHQYLNQNININIVPFYTVRNRKYLIGYIPYFKNLFIINKLLKIIESRKYDFIYIIVNEEHDAILAKELKRRGYQNGIIAYHEVVKNHIGEQNLKDVVLETLKLGYPIICHSNHTREALLKLIDKESLHSTNVHTIYFGPFETYQLYDTSERIIKDRYILFIGSIQPYKGLSFLYDTIKQHGIADDIKVVVAGSGYDACLDNMRNDKRFIVINRFLSNSEFANLTRYAECIICPYVSGSQSGITHTAFVYGTPVIATKVGAFPEFLEDGKNGYLIDYGDETALSSAINKIIYKGPITKDFIPEHLTWEDIVGKLENLLMRRG